MTKENRDMLYTAAVAIAIVVLYLVYKKSQPTVVANPDTTAGSPLPVGWQEPMTSVYGANPTAYMPANPLDLTLNIPNQMGNYLTNSYIPLFGMVGIAQGQLYQ